MRAKRHIKKITHQAAGAFGEKAAEAELLRHNWIPANVNQTVKNAAKFDIFAVKADRPDRSVQIRVKTCRPKMTGFLWGGFSPDAPISTADIAASDFTVVVRMGERREQDRFYVVPTAVAWKEIANRQSEHRNKKTGVKEIGMWRLTFRDRKDGQEEAGRGIERKWGKYEDSWDLLDG
ncbi:MAG TPA: hypothetical protein VGS13_16595 [Stellaceae bacterium]|nr:hypothetical protein [Stellaceae bacterium]